MESLKEIALKELESTECPNCGDQKEKGHSFCRSCYFSLPRTVRMDLYRTFSEGYASDYDEAKRMLREL